MKKLLLIFCILGMGKMTSAQWTTSGNDIYNSNAGNVGIGTTSPTGKLVISNSGANGVEINPVTGLNSGSDIISYNRSNSTYTPMQFAAKEYVIGTSSVSSAMFIAQNGNIGIGTTNPDNAQNWNKVFNLHGSNHAKLLITESTDGVKTGIFSHQGYNGKIGTESNHNLTLMAGYWNDVMTLTTTGNVGIGTTSPDSKLTVAGKIHSQEVKVTVNAGADFVFNDSYKPLSLAATESFIKANKHLPEIASAEEMKKDGLELGEMNIKLLQKIEELTLYLIEKDKQVTDLQERMKIVEGKKQKNKNFHLYNGKER